MYYQNEQQLLTLEETDSTEDLIQFLTNNEKIDKSRPVLIDAKSRNLDEFEVLIGFAQRSKFNLQVLSTHETKELFNARLQRAFQISQKNYDNFLISTDSQTQQINLNLNDKAGLNFDENNSIFQNIKEIFKLVNDGNSLKISAHPHQIDTSQLANLIEYLATNRHAYQIILEPTETFQQENQRLDDYYRYALRKKLVDNELLNNLVNPFEEASAAAPKLRRTKQLLKQGIRINFRTQHQVHHQNEHAVQQQEQIQQEQENQQQQFLSRENQIAQQQQRMLKTNQQSQQVDITSLGRLIHRDNLSELVSPEHPLEEIETIWFALVGKHANYVENPANRISHVPEASFRLIMQHKEQFSGGIHFNNLPNGFGFDVIQNEGSTQSILYYDKKLEKIAENRTDSFLAPQLLKEKKPLTDFGTVGQFYPFFAKDEALDYLSFCEQHREIFTTLYYPDLQTTLENRKQAFINLLILDNADIELLKNQLAIALSDFSSENLNSIANLLLTQGSQTTTEFLLNIEGLKANKLYDLFKSTFLDKTQDWQNLIARKPSHKNELGASEAINYLKQMSPTERLWWQELLTQHAKANNKNDFVDLVNAQKYFFDQIKEIDPQLQLPSPCPLKNISNLKTAYDRLLYVLKKAINPAEQATYLEGLDWGPQGIVCDTQRYILVTEKMALTPNSGISDWTKYANYIPTFDSENWVAGPTGANYQNEFLITYRRHALKVEQIPEAYLSPPGFSTSPHTRKTHSLIDKVLFGEGGIYYTDQLKLLDRDKEGFLRIVTMEVFFDDPIEIKYKNRIDNPELQDDAIATRFDKLGYGIDFETLLDFSTKLSLFFNLEKYFYRYVGTQPYSHNFALYGKIIEEIRSCSLNNNLKKQILPLLATATTGARALKNENDLFMDLNAVLTTINSSSEHYAKILSQINQAFSEIEIKPTLPELNALLKLAMNENLTTLIVKSIAKQGEVFFQVLTNLNQRQDPLNEQNILEFMNLASTKTIADPLEKNVFFILFSLVKTEEWTEFGSLQNPVLKINPNLFPYLDTLLKTVNVVESHPLLTRADLARLVEELNKIKEEDLSLDLVQHLTIKTLSNLRFKDTNLAQSISALIKMLAPFVDALEEAIKSLKDKVNEIQPVDNPYLNTDQQQGLIIQIVDKIIKKITPITTGLRLVNQSGKTEDIHKILGNIQNLISMFDDPLEGIDIPGMNSLALGFIRVAINTMIAPIKKTIISTISKHIFDFISLEIKTSVANLRINDTLIKEKDSLLSTKFSEFLINQLPSIGSQEITFEINEIFRHQEIIGHLVKQLKLWAPKQRDLLLLELYRSDYFQTKPPLPSLPELSDIVSMLRNSTRSDLEPMLKMILQAYREKRDPVLIQSLVRQLDDGKYQLTEKEFAQLFAIGMNNSASVNHLLQIKLSLIAENNLVKQKAFNHLLENVHQNLEENTPQRLENLLDFMGATINEIDNTASFINFCFNQQNQGKPLEKIDELINVLMKTDKGATHGLMTILANSCWSNADEASRSVEDQINLTKKLATLPQEIVDSLVELYVKKPSPGFSSLSEQIQKDKKSIEKWIMDYELDPFGKHSKVLAQYTMQGISNYVNEIRQLQDNNKLSIELQNKLMDGFAYILACSNEFSLPVGNSLKPLNQYKRKELSQYYQDCIDRVRQNPEDLEAKLEGLAILCQVMLRTNGKYPYHSQIISALTTIYCKDSMLLQIPTGQGKSITNALLAAMNFSFEQPSQVSVTSRNKFLIRRDYKESLDFYNYLDIPVAFVTASTQKNHFLKPTIVYSTVSDASLYESKLKMIDNYTLPSKKSRIIIADEIDADIHDNKNAFNFSNSSEDLYFNPLEWLYTLANLYVDDPFFLNEDIFEHEDINLFRAFIQQKQPALYQQFKTRLTDFKLSQFIDSACISKQLIEDQDFIVRKISREVHGKNQIISEAHPIINNVEDSEATLSNGVQQSLHDRLNKRYQQEIENYKKDANQGIPPFSCDNQIECIDSQTAKSFFSKFGKIIGTTATGGTSYELSRTRKELGIEVMLNIPPRRQSKLQYLPTIFANDENSFFFSSDTHLQALEREISLHPHQPLMITCKDITKAEFLFKELAKKHGEKVQVIHAKNANDPLEFEEMIEKAKNSGQITVVTPIAGRGVDIKTLNAGEQEKKSNQQHQLDQLAEILLVIETNLDRHRNRRQIQGRTARDGKEGQTIGIFDLNEISELQGSNVKQLSREQKLELLDNLVKKMDDEATVERLLINKVNDIVLFFEDQFDSMSSRVSQESIAELRLAKTAFLIQAEQIWSELLSESDPNAELANPYIRYNEEGQLDKKALKPFREKYQERIEVLFNESIKNIIPQKTTKTNKEPMRYKKPSRGEAKLALESSAENIEDLKESEPLVSFLNHNKQKNDSPEYFNSYLDNLELEQKFNERLHFWLIDNPKIKETLKSLAANQEIFRRQQIRLGKSQLSANLDGLTQALTNQHAVKIKQLFDFNALAYQDLNLLPELGSTKETSVAVSTMLSQALDNLIFEANKIDRKVIIQLKEEVGELKTLPQLLAKIPILFTKAELKLNDKKIKDCLESIKNFSNTLSRFSILENEVIHTDPREAGLRFMLEEILDFLSNTKNRIEGTNKPFKKDKLNYLDTDIETLSDPEAINNLLTEHKDVSLEGLLNQLNNMVSKTLTYNTNSGEFQPNSTRSEQEYKQLTDKFKEKLGFEKALEAQPPLATRYLTRLEAMLADLKIRKDAAGIWKDKNLYERKVKKFETYIKQTEALINAKGENPEIESEIRSLLIRMRNDQDIYTNTSSFSFFKSNSNVTLMKEIEALSEELRPPRLN